MAKDQERKKKQDKHKSNDRSTEKQKTPKSKPSKRKLNFDETTPKRVRKQKQCTTCDDCVPSTSYANNEPQNHLLVSLPSDTEDETFEKIHDSNNSATIELDEEDRNARTKFVYERTEFRNNASSGAQNNKELPTINVETLVEEEDNEETLEQIYAKIQEKLAAKKRSRNNETNNKNSPAKPKGKNRVFTEELVNREISKIRDQVKNTNRFNARSSDSETTIYTHACR